MFTWKRLFLSLGFLFFIVIIGWTTWYITIVRPKIISEPVVIYNVEKPKAAEKTTDTLLVKTSEKKDNIQADDVEAKKLQNGVSQSKVVQRNNTSAQTKQKSEENKHSSETHQHTKEDLARWAKEIKELEDREKVIHEKLAHVKADLRNLDKSRQRRLNEKANRLNSLSAEEQQAYFENIRSGNILKDIPSNFFSIFRNSAQTLGISDEIADTFVGDFKQRMQEYASEAGANRHLEELRAHGFEPKF